MIQQSYEFKKIHAPQCSMFTAALFTIAKIRKQSKCPSADVQKKNEYIYIHTYTHTMEYYSATKRNKILSFGSG